MHNKPFTNLFVCEFITAGGFNHADLPTKLVHEGQLMRDALLRDLSSLPYKISTTVDARLPVPTACHISYVLVVSREDDVWNIWEQAIIDADAVWLIAPETDGLLRKLTSLVVKHKKLILGCNENSIEATGNKLACYYLLEKARIATPTTFKFESWAKVSDGAWVAKPIDGAGCDETMYFSSAEMLRRWVVENNKSSSHVIQPYQAGVHASISCIMHLGSAQLLSCNRQLISLDNNVFSYKGSIVNGMKAYWEEFDEIANRIAEALPGLCGYVGIDLIVDDEKLIVVEINPRLTSSYSALTEAIAYNPAALVINTLTQDNYEWPKLQKNVVEIHV